MRQDMHKQKYGSKIATIPTVWTDINNSEMPIVTFT